MTRIDISKKIKPLQRKHLLTQLLKTAIQKSDHRVLIGCVSDSVSFLPESYKTICTAAEFTTHRVRKLDFRESFSSPNAIIDKKVKIVKN